MIYARMREHDAARRESRRKRKAAPDGPRSGEGRTRNDVAVTKYHKSEAAATALDHLDQETRWVAWRTETVDGRLTKVPYSPVREGHKAKSDDPATWGTREQAEALARKMGAALGIMLGVHDGITLGGLDLDGCIDPETGAVAGWAADILDRFDSYAEVSPSGTGAKILYTYEAEDLDAAREDFNDGVLWGRTFATDHKGPELHMGNRFYAVTLQRLDPSPDEILPVERAALTWLLTEAGPAWQGYATRQDRSAVLLAIAGRFKRQGRTRAEYEVAARADTAAAAHLKAQGRNAQRALNRAWDKASGEPDMPADLAEMNRTYAYVRMGAKHRVMVENGDGSLDFLEERTFHAETAALKTAKGKALSQAWMAWPQRRSYTGGVAFAPGGCGADTFNTWQGWSVEPDDPLVDPEYSACRRFLAHVREVICNGCQTCFDYLMGWMAHMVQRPGEKPEVAVVLRGDKGAGKDAFGRYLARLCRAHYRSLTRPEDLTAKFNAMLADALILHAEETFWAGDHGAESRLKTLISSDSQTIERKGVDAAPRPSCCRVIMSANADWVVPASDDERRYAVFDVSPAHVKDAPYFEALHREMDCGGPEELLYLLQHYDLTGFNVRGAPNTAGLSRQKLESLRDFDAYWFEELADGRLWAGDASEDGADEGLELSRSTLRESYDQWRKGQNYRPRAYNAEGFGRAVRRVCPQVSDGNRAHASAPRTYRFPPLADCRAAFDAKMGFDASFQHWSDR